MDEINVLIKEEEKNVRELEKITFKIIDLKRNMVQNVWNIGAELNKVKDKKLFLYKYPTFLDYLDKEVKFSQRSAYSFMKIAQNMDSQLVANYGTTKCGLLVSLDEEKREKFIKTYTEPIIKDMSKREFIGALKEFKKPESDFEDECDVDRDYFMECLELGEEILRDYNRLREKIKKFDDYMDGIEVSRKSAFNNYEYKNKILELKKKIKEVK